MSGIFGVINLGNDTINENHYNKCLKLLEHRGTDGICSKSINTFFVTYFHQNTTYQSFNEQQPIIENELLVVADIRLDNRAELCKALDIELSDLICDSQLAKFAYIKWGIQSFEKLVGDFALIIYDKAINKLFLVRDYSGVRPLYYTIWENKLFFSSEIKGFFGLQNFKLVPNKRRIEEFFKIPGLPQNYQKDTFYSGIFQVLPAHYITLDLTKKKLNEICFWDLLNSPYQFLTDEQLLNEFKEVFHQTIKSRVYTPFNVASIISGGIDSSSVTIIANKYIDKSKHQLSTYFFKPCIENTFEEKKVNDFISKTNLPYYSTNFGTDLLLNNEKVCTIIDAPELYPIKYNTLKNIFEEIRKNDCRILLTGTDGDSVVGMGEAVFYKGLKDNNIPLFIKYLKEKYSLNNADLKSNFGDNKEIMYGQIISKTLNNTIKVYGKFKGIYIGLKILFEQNLFSFKGLIFQINEKLKNQKEHTERQKFIRQNKPTTKTGNALFQNGNYFQLSTERQEYLDHIGAFYNVEVSHPILDKRLIEICFFISPEIKFWEGRTRGPLRFVSEDYLPNSYKESKTKSDNDYLFTLKQETFYDIKSIKRFIEENKETINQLSKDFKTYNYKILKKKLRKIPYHSLNCIIQLVSWMNNLKKYE